MGMLKLIRKAPPTEFYFRKVKSMKPLGIGQNLHAYRQELFCTAVSHVQFTEL